MEFGVMETKKKIQNRIWEFLTGKLFPIKQRGLLENIVYLYNIILSKEKL